METGPAPRDATRRTRLANERTYLAWWIAFAVVGIAFMSFGYMRHRDVETALDRGDYAGLEDRAAFIFAAVGTLLGIATVLLVVINTS